MRTRGFLLAAAAAAAVVITLSGCGGLPAAETRAYLDSIPLGDLPTLAAAKGAGIWSGTYTIAMPPGAVAMYRTVSVDVTIGVGAPVVTAIKITSPAQLDTADFAQKIIPQVMGPPQTLVVDGVSGASFSSKAFVKAVENALSK
jgi:uncharacterized protein with FMN-binding domain